jgi:hypothetical protein
MVQVDVFWAYGLGGSLAAAAGRQLKTERDPFVTSYFVKTVLFLALIWAPTGLLLLLRHPSWETMQAAPSMSAMPPFLVLAFGITNVTQGVLGFWVSQRLMARGKHYAAHLNWLFGYIGMFFILLYGWDGLGYDRFLYDRDMFGGVAWSPGAGLQHGAGALFLGSSVARTLYLDGVFLLPPLLYWFGKWIVAGANADASIPDSARPKSAAALGGLYLIAVFFLAVPTSALGALSAHFVRRLLLSAGVSSGASHVLGYAFGIPLAAVVAWALVYRRGMPGHALLRKLYVAEAEKGEAHVASRERIAPTSRNVAEAG